MICFRPKNFSIFNYMIEEIKKKLESNGVEDFEVSQKIPKDSISITGDIKNIRIYIPMDMEYSQIKIEDFIRKLSKFNRCSTNLDRNIFVMRLSDNLTLQQYIKLVEYIIEEEGYCTILDNIL